MARNIHFLKLTTIIETSIFLPCFTPFVLNKFFYFNNISFKSYLVWTQTNHRLVVPPRQLHQKSIWVAKDLRAINIYLEEQIKFESHVIGKFCRYFLFTVFEVWYKRNTNFFDQLVNTVLRTIRCPCCWNKIIN